MLLMGVNEADGASWSAINNGNFKHFPLYFMVTPTPFCSTTTGNGHVCEFGSIVRHRTSATTQSYGLSAVFADNENINAKVVADQFGACRIAGMRVALKLLTRAGNATGVSGYRQGSYEVHVAWNPNSSQGTQAAGATALGNGVDSSTTAWKPREVKDMLKLPFYKKFVIQSMANAYVTLDAGAVADNLQVIQGGTQPDRFFTIFSKTFPSSAAPAILQASSDTIGVMTGEWDNRATFSGNYANAWETMSNIANRLGRLHVMISYESILETETAPIVDSILNTDIHSVIPGLDGTAAFIFPMATKTPATLGMAQLVVEYDIELAKPLEGVGRQQL